MSGDPPGDYGRESRWEKDDTTVESMYALFSATVLAALVLGAFVYVAHLFVGGSPVVVQVGVGAAALVWIARVVQVLVRHQRRRDLGR
ncbi:hypothetical protein DY218_29320 [Streptomyces triticagri]|uniref:Uncharacterized protein n=1 Tax=Streptomyces triticagri TaxID=2293568 RepID=A0A372LWT7_9ACTN|nr:DUF6332 family protein [Streptomyces triticagri]RFU83138.1 hypothetical protein DY218_29320 [Streptomyces triticagri]